MRALPTVAAAAVAVLVLAGCNDNGEPDDVSAPTTSSSAPTSTPAETTSTPPSPEPSTSEPAPSPTATENSMPDACSVVTAQQMADVLFFPVELTTTEGGCRYAVPDDPAAPAVEYVQTSGVDDAAIAEAKDTSVQRTDAQLQPVDEVGDDAWFAVGEGPDGQITGSGGVVVGTTLVQVFLTQGMDQIEPEVGQAVIDAVGLAGDALGG